LEKVKLTLRRRNVLLVLVLVSVLVVSLFVVVNEFSVPVQSASDEQFFVGVEIGWKANATECKAVIDKVKNYTNLLILAHSTIMCDEAALNETCDYAYDAGMYIMVNFMNQMYSGWGTGSSNSVQYYPFIWMIKARDRYGDHFLGAYYDDEVGGNLLDSGTTPDYANPYTLQSYKDAANSFIRSTAKNMDAISYLGQRMNIPMFTSDYGLYWFDYKAGYDVVLAEFAWNNSRPLQVALCRGAAKLQNKDWGIMMTWTYNHPPYLESADELYEDMVFAYNSGAKYVAVYDAWSTEHVNSTLTEGHFDALKSFWEYVQQNPDKHGSLKADTVLVLPENYGFGFRNPCDTIWGYNTADMWTRKMYDDVYGLLDEYGSSLDIVYSDPEFNDALADSYSEVLTWTAGPDADNYPVVNLNTGMGYSTIQEAINTLATCDGHTIFVKAGVYPENLFVIKGVTLMGEDRKTTVIDGGNLGSAVTISGIYRDYVDFLDISYVAGVNITGFTIRNGGVSSLEANNSAPLFASGINLTLTSDCNIVGNDIVGNGVGVYLLSSGNNRFRDNTIENNVVNFGVDGNSLSEYVNDIDSSNTVDGKPICYWVNKHNLVVPSDAGYVALVNCTDMTVQNLQLANNYNGLLVAYTHNSTITGNTFTNNWEGLTLAYSSGNVLSGNNMHDNRYAFSFKGRLANDIDTTNTVDGKPIIYWVDQHNKTVPSDAGYVALINCTGITVQNLQLSNNCQGIFLINTRNTIITQNTITNQLIGIELESASNNTITNNFIHANTKYGINIVSSNNNSFDGNTITGNGIGIYVKASSNNSIYRNNITANNQAIRFVNSITANSTYNTVNENNIALNEIHIYTESDANYNTIYHNNFIDNTQQQNDYSDNSQYGPVVLLDVINSWDNGCEGNYWSDYEDKYPNATELGNSGVWDIPYSVWDISYSVLDVPYYIPVIGVDNFPLMQPYPIPHFQSP
jgi:parallel beta-helix repeat protein